MNKEQREKLTVLLNLRLEELKRKDIEHPRYENMLSIASVIKVMDDMSNEQGVECMKQEDKRRSMKTKLVPFDIEKAKQGAKVITKDGRPVRICAYDVKCVNKDYPILALVQEGENEITYSFMTNGKFFQKENKDSPNDLFIEEEVEETDNYDNIWNKKQGEKPADNKPEFQEGDWVVFNPGCNAHQIVRVVENATSHTYGYDTVDDYYFNDTTEGVRLWNITDAKDGDVLVNGSNIFIFHFINDTRIMGYCHVNTYDDGFYIDLGKNDGVCHIAGVVTPATKEQCDLLFQRMKETGYIWDSDKKELHKIGESKTRLMTHQELADWLRDAPEEHREYRYAGDKDVYNTYDYPEDEANTPVDENIITIRRNHGEWQEPLIEE